MANKYLIVDNKVIMGPVEHHYELVPKGYNHISGGGRFVVDDDTKRIIFYDTSDTYKGITKQILIAALNNTDLDKLNEYSIFFSKCMWQTDAIKDCNNRTADYIKE